MILLIINVVREFAHDLLMKTDLILVGDLHALCTKDSDCQRYMLCSGMEDGTRRCHCQTLYNYDNERQQCRK
jgi:hypothetical protein